MAIPVCIVLAEADFAETAKIRSHIAAEFQAGIAIASNYQQLLATVERESPQLVILGRIDNFNYFEICEECHSRQADLPIVMLSKQKAIGSSFIDLLQSYGLTDIITEDYSKLNKLLRQIAPKPVAQKPPQPPQPVAEAKAPIPTGEILLAALIEIVAASNNYFGALAQGNYWRKAHERVVRPLPLLQHWSADHFGKIHCDEQTRTRSLDREDLEALRMWVQNYIEECERTIVDFRSILKSAELSPLAQSLLPEK